MVGQITNQLILGISLRDEYDFSQFAAGENGELVRRLKYFSGAVGDVGADPRDVAADELTIYFWGPKATGKTHLLHSVCHEATKHGLSCSYLPIHQLLDYGPGIFDGLEEQNIVCIDDIEPMVGQPKWEEGLFHLFNKLRERQNKLIVTAGNKVQQLHFVLPDLASRLSWGLSYKLVALADVEKIEVLQSRAKNRGFHLSDEVARYILNRGSRDFSSLIEVLDRLDELSLKHKRKLTIPFVKDVMAW